MDVLPLQPTEPAAAIDITPAAMTNSVPPQRSSESAAPTEKTQRINFAGLDAVRAFAGLSVVLLHSCVPYLVHPMPGLSWPVRDTPSTAIDLLFWSIELFIMPLFLVLAGFFAWQTLERRGPRALVTHRARRLLIPLTFGILFVLPLDLYSWVTGWVAEGLVSPIKLRSLKFDDGVDKDLWGLSHLWFLQYLFIYITGVACFGWAHRRFPWLRRFQPSLFSAVALTIALGSVVLYFHPQVVWGFQHSFFPVASKWLYSGIFFVFGMILAVNDGNLEWLKRHSSRLVAPACLALLAALSLGCWQLSVWETAKSSLNQASNPLDTGVLDTGVLDTGVLDTGVLDTGVLDTGVLDTGVLAAGALAITTTTSALLITLAVLGVSVKQIQRVPAVVSYLAAASFWVYIVHHPIIGLVHLDLKWMLPNLPSSLKVVGAFAVTCTFSLMIYESFVRRTAFGRLLGFAWEFPKTTAKPAPHLLSIERHRASESVAERLDTEDSKQGGRAA